jgi:hypothetical protein
MDKQNAIHPYNGILFSHKKEQSIVRDKPWKHYAKWKKSHIVGFDLHEISRMDRVKGNGAETRIRKYGVIWRGDDSVLASVVKMAAQHWSD